MQLGHLNQKANQGLVFFVFECILAIIFLLNLMQQAVKVEYKTILESEAGVYYID